jgi:dienelactone hydrolase
MEQVNDLKRALCCVCLLPAIASLLWSGGFATRPESAESPGERGPCAATSQVVEVGGSVETHIYFPADEQCTAGLAAPYPGVAFAHGFSMFGLTNGAEDNAGHGEHLASWGYVVAIPVLPDEVEGRIANLEDVLSYLEEATGQPSSFLYDLVDVDRLAVVGHSFGGASVLALAATDPRVNAVVALDPVYHQGGPGTEPEIWDHDVEGPKIAVPTTILGGPSSDCNSESDHAEIYPFVGSAHKAQFHISGASHCDFSDPGNDLCYFVCGGSDDQSDLRTQLVQKYLTAWLNYYLHHDTDSFDYLYGPEANGDIASGFIQRDVDTAPQNVRASGRVEAVSLQWMSYDHPVVTGYYAYRRRAGEVYPDLPQIEVGSTGNHVDEGLAVGETYYYVLCSHDGVGHEHQRSPEVSAMTLGDLDERLYMPLVARQ